MKALTDYILALRDLLKAEANAMRRDCFRTSVAVIIMAFAAVLALGAFACIFAALFMFVNSLAGPASAACITGAAALLLAFIIAEVAIWLAR